MNPDNQAHNYTDLPNLLLRLSSTSELCLAYEKAKKIGCITAATLIKAELDKRTTPPPERKKVPMTAEDFPPVFWVRNKSDVPNWALVTAISSCLIWLGDYSRSYKELLEQGWEYSPDRKEAKGCWKYE